ncbi:MAG: DUF4493 domain-containing protein [Alistipes sp.]|nr:DUF4493 domain-containing protein [Alistipes sp.]
MKKILALVSAVLVLASCAKDMEPQIEMGMNEGAMRFGLTMQSDVRADQNIVIKIYKVAGEDKTLVRRYTSLADIPEYLTLLGGNYLASVQVGEKSVVSFDEKCYAGEQAFTITGGSVTPVTVDCKLLSTIARVEYDATVADKLKAGYSTTVAVAESYDQSAVNTGDIHSLTYTETKDGYFMMPVDQTSLVWHFEGTSTEDKKIVKEGKIENVKPAAKYTILLRYSKDANGSVQITATVDESVEVFDDNISFSPDPTIIGDGFDLTEEQLSTTASRTYNITSLASIKTMSIEADGAEFDLINNAPAGVTVSKISDTSYMVTIAEAFFANVTAGHNTIAFHVEDVDGGKLTKEIAYNVQGVMPLATSDYDLWFGNVTFKANVVDASASSVKIAYRANGGAWTEVAATAAGEGIYTATGSNFAAEKNYEYKLIVGGADSGKMLAHATAAGAQIPNGDMESWSVVNDVVYPYAAGASPFWLTGNDGAKMAGATLTKSSTDVRPGSAGSYSAHLKSQFASVMGIGKFAAGNLFVGTFSMSGLDGTVNFGRDFNFTAKPKSMSFWMKHNEGTIDKGAGTPSEATGTDKATIMVIITNWDTPYAVNTKDQSTFFSMSDLATMDGVIGYGYIEKRESATDWKEYTINITYREDMKNEKPKKLVVSFTPSGFGDYFTGSTESWMYVDDIVLNY